MKANKGRRGRAVLVPSVSLSGNDSAVLLDLRFVSFFSKAHSSVLPSLRCLWVPPYCLSSCTVYTHPDSDRRREG